MPILFDDTANSASVHELQHKVTEMAVSAQAMLDAEHSATGAHTAVTLDSIGARVSGSPPELTDGLRFLSGPLAFESDGNPSVTSAALRAPMITADQHDYRPDGIDDTVVLELESDAPRAITGIFTSARRRRFLWVINRGSHPITLAHNSASSTAIYWMSFSTITDFVLQSGGMLLLYYDVGSEVWRGEGHPVPPVTSVQRGTITLANGDTSDTATISDVGDVSLAEVTHLGQSAEVGASVSTGTAYIVLTNTTTITATRGVGVGELIVSFEVKTDV